jgi:hypothetical protein
MKNALKQIRKIYDKKRKDVYFIDNCIFYNAVEDFFYKKGLKLQNDASYKIDFKILDDFIKSFNEIKSLNIIDGYLIINDSYKLKLNTTQIELPAMIYNDDLLNTSVFNNLVSLDDLKSVTVAAAKYEPRSTLNNIFVSDELCCTDGSRLHVNADFEINPDFKKKPVLFNADLINKNTTASKKVMLYLSKDRKLQSVVCDDGILTKYNILFDAEYPKYKQLIPQKMINSIKLNNIKNLIKTLKEAKKHVNKTLLNPVMFDFNHNKIKVVDSMGNLFIYDYDYEIIEKAINQKNNEFQTEYIVFDINYLLDVLNSIKSDNVIFNYSNKLGTAFFEAENQKMLLMPCQLKNTDFYNYEKTDAVETINDNKVETSENKEQIETNEPETSNAVETENKTSRPFNPVTNKQYNGQNAVKLLEAMRINNYSSYEFVARGQAYKLHKQVKKDAKGIEISVYCKNDVTDTEFYKVELVYNISELEQLEKIEKTNDYKNMVERLKVKVA